MPATLPVPLLAAQPVDGVVAGKPLSGSIVADQPFSLVRLFFVAANLPADLPASSATGMLSNGQYIVGDLAIKDDLTLWVCTTAGTNATSVWAKISGGGGGSFAFWTLGNAYAVGATVQVQTQTVVGGVTVTPGTYGCMVAVDESSSGNKLPQYPYPATGTVYWMLIALGITPVNVCSAGNKTIYINSSDPF